MKTKSEALFETFLATNNLTFEKIKEETSRSPEGQCGENSRPDCRVSIGDLDLIFELKELTQDDNFGVIKDQSRPDIKSNSRTLGDHVRRRIEGSRKQLQYGAKLGCASALLIYNSLDPIFQMFGTEDMDFTAAMYGEYTIVLNKQNRKASDWYNGKKRLLQENKNTSFSAVGRLSDLQGVITVTLFENVFAKVKIPYGDLPACFDVRRVQVSASL